MRAKPSDIDDYLDRLPADQRVALERLRRTIRAIIPRAQECISYQLPAFRLDGKVVAWFGAGKHHCSFYPGGIAAEFAKELKDFEISKGTVRFQPDHPIPATLLRKMIKAHVARRLARSVAAKRASTERMSTTTHASRTRKGSRR